MYVTLSNYLFIQVRFVSLKCMYESVHLQEIEWE